MARDVFQTVSKRYWLNTGDKNGETDDPISIGDFINCLSDDKLNFILDHFRPVTSYQDSSNKETAYKSPTGGTI